MTTPVTGCSGKKVYTTFTQASRGARRLRKRQDDSHVEAYHCRHCNRFHVGEARSYGQIDKRKDVRP